MKKIAQNVFLLMILFVSPNFVWAAAGDQLINCTFGENGSTAKDVVLACGANNNFGSLNLSSGAIVDGGHDGGKAISFYYPYSGTHHELYDPFGFSLPTHPAEITVTYWEKLSVNPTTSTNWNIKGFRAYNGNGVNGSVEAYIGGYNSYTGDRVGMFSHLNSSSPYETFVAGAVSYVTTWAGPPSYCTLVSGSTYTCGRYVSAQWSGTYGTSWHEIRTYLKAPSDPHNSSNDGIIEHWIDGELVATITGVNGERTTTSGTMQPYFDRISFHPSDDFWDGQNPNAFTFHHMYDDIVVFDGYVPPSGADTTAPGAPSGLLVV